MNKRDFFLTAMQAEEYKRKAFVISAFSLIKEAPDAWQKNPYAFRIVQTPTGHFFIDPSSNNSLTAIPGTVANEPIFKFSDKVTLNKGDLPNVTETIETTYGNLLFNYIVLVYPFKDKIKFVEGKVTPKDMEKLILLRLKDTPATDEERNNKDIYVDEYLQFCDAMFYLAGFTQLCCPAATRKTMTCSPDIVEFKQKLLNENKDRLHDPAVIAKIDAELVKHDKEWMKGDLGEGFLIGKKSFNIVRKKLYGMHGAEVGLSEGIDVDLIENSLSQGWDISKFPAMNNSLRAGSFNRGANTMLGGESVKWLLRASSNITVTAKDCGSRLGNIITIDGTNFNWLTGFSIVTPTGSELVPDAETAKKYVGKTVTVRSPMFCKLEKTDYCACCVGMRLAENPTGISAAISHYGSTFLALYMAMAHGKELALAKLNYKTAIM